MDVHQQQAKKRLLGRLSCFQKLQQNKANYVFYVLITLAHWTFDSKCFSCHSLTTPVLYGYLATGFSPAIKVISLMVNKSAHTHTHTCTLQYVTHIL